MTVSKGKYITVGIGSSSNPDPYAAGKVAANEAIAGFDKIPTFSLVYTNAAFDQAKIAKGITEVLGKNWVGASADKQFNSEFPYSDGTTVSILSIRSDYMHFGVGVAKNYRKNPSKAAVEATAQAVRSMKSDKYLDSYIQFSRAKKQEYNKIVRTPPYFMLMYCSGAEFKGKKSMPGAEIEFLNGVLDYLGPHIPVFGGSASSDFHEYLYKNKGTNYQFANGEALTDAGVVVFVICNLFFKTEVEHGHLLSDKYASITALDKSGYEILGLNGNSDPVAEYCALIGVKKMDYLKDPFKYSLTHPFGFITLEGDAYVREALPNPDNKTFHSTYQIKKNYVLNILRYSPKSHFNTMMTIMNRAGRGEGKVALTLFCNCSSRRVLMPGVDEKIKKVMKSNFKGMFYFGFYSFGEFGSTSRTSAQLHSETVTSLILFDKLLVE